MPATATSALLKGLLTSPVNPASCSCARGLAVAITELAGAVPGMAALADPSAVASASASAAAATAVPMSSRATWGTTTKSPMSSLRAETSTTNTTSAVERLQAELRAPPPPPELAADGLASGREALWMRRLALMD
jgi:hypothetical protein